MNKQRTRTLIEIGIAGVLGAVIGLSIATRLELPPWLWIPCGLVTALCYRPWEIFVVVGEISSELWHATSAAIRSARGLPNLSISINWGKVRKVMIIATQILCSAAAVWIGASYIGIVLYLTAPNPPEGVSMYVLGIPFMTVFFTALAGAFVACFLGVSYSDVKNRKNRWLFPLGTRLAEFFFSGESSAKEKDAEKKPFFPLSKGDFLGFSVILLFVPLFVQLFVVFTVVLFLVDFVVTVVLACASTERLASVAGGTLGCMAGALARVAGVNDEGSLLIIGGLVGLITGPGLYDLRLVLGRPKHTVATTA